jgi:hypothetical protein
LPHVPNLTSGALEREIAGASVGATDVLLSGLFGAFDSGAAPNAASKSTTSPSRLSDEEGVHYCDRIAFEEHSPETQLSPAPRELRRYETSQELATPLSVTTPQTLATAENMALDSGLNPQNTAWSVASSEVSEQNDDEYYLENACPAMDIGQNLEKQLIPSYQLILSPIPRAPLDHLHQPCNAAIHHFATRVAHYMMPVEVPHKENPWLDIYLPRAVSTYRSSNGGNALFHALLSTACFHQSQLADSEEHERAGEYHQYKAFQDLRVALSTLHPDTMTMDDVISALACVLMMTTIEAMRGTSGGWTLHLDGASRLLKTVERQSGSEGQRHAIQVLCQIHDCLRTLMDTLGPHARSRSDDSQKYPPKYHAETQAAASDRQTGLQAAWLDSEFYCLDRTYGISIDTLVALKRINKLGINFHDTVLSEIDTISESLHCVLPKATRRHVGAQNCHSKARPLKMASLSSPVAQEVMEHHCWAFHFATMLYFNRVFRLVQDTTTSVQQWLAGEALNHLESIESIAGEEARPVTLWPFLIASCEASETALRHRVIVLFARMERFGIGNIKIAKKVVLEVWRRMDREKLETGPGSKNQYATLSALRLNDPSSPMSSSHRTEELITPVDWREVMMEMSADIVMA